MRARKNRNKKMKSNMKNANNTLSIDNVSMENDNTNQNHEKNHLTDQQQIMENENGHLAEVEDLFGLSLTRGFIANNEYSPLNSSHLVREIKPEVLQQIVEDDFDEQDIDFIEDIVDFQEDRNRKIKKLATDVEQLYEIMTDLNTIVHEQDEQLNIIDKNIESSYVKMEDGNKNLTIADENQSYSNNLKYTLIGIPTAILVTIIALVKS